MSKYIDYDGVLDKLAGHLWIESWESPYPSDDIDEHYAHAKKMLKDFEMIDIVRCKDCKHKYVEGYTTHYYWCRLHDRPVDDTDFCTWGERTDK